ncbi:MAG: ABC transporter ATP-binding protein [Planctomycetota bacterium]
MLTVTNLTKRYQTHKKRQSVLAVDSISFSINPGEIYGLLGPNGAGKTTTIRMLAGLLTPTSGEIGFEGVPIRESPETFRSKCGIVPEASGVYNKLNPVEYLDFFGRMYHVPGLERVKRISELLEQFELAEQKHRRLETFSKGMKQKVNLARALLHHPRILMMDEPTHGLDPAMTEMFWQLLIQLRTKENATIILCTHNLDEAERLCDKVAIILKGQIIKEGSPERLSGQAQKTRCVLTLKSPRPDIVIALKQLPGIESVLNEEPPVIHFTTALPADEINPQAALLVVKHGGELVSLYAEKTTLREIYLAAIKG